MCQSKYGAAFVQRRSHPAMYIIFFCVALRRFLHGCWAVWWFPFLDFLRHLLVRHHVDFAAKDQIRRHVPHVPFIHVFDALAPATQVDACHSELLVAGADKRFLCTLAFSATVPFRSSLCPVAFLLPTAASAAFAFASARGISLRSVHPSGTRPAHVADRFLLGAASAAMAGSRSSCSRRAAQAQVPGLSSPLRWWRSGHAERRVWVSTELQGFGYHCSSKETIWQSCGIMCLLTYAASAAHIQHKCN